jgi:hypothetical protein
VRANLGSRSHIGSGDAFAQSDALLSDLQIISVIVASLARALFKHLLLDLERIALSAPSHDAGFRQQPGAKEMGA